MTSSIISPFTGPLLRKLGNALAGPDPAFRRFCIVNYHRILEQPDPFLESEPDVAAFRWQMELLARSFNVIPLVDAVHAMENGSLPPRAVCITFDDGYRSIHDLALPILKECGLTATVFVSSGYLTDDSSWTESMWNDRILEAVRRLPNPQLDLTSVGLGIYPMKSQDERKLTASRLTEDSKYLPPARRLELTQTIESLAQDVGKLELMLTKDMVLHLSRQGLEIGGHTVTHPILTSLEDQAARQEIVDNKAHLEAIIGKPLRAFAYPNGKIGADFDERHVRMVQDAGYEAGFTTAIGAAGREHHRYMLPRCRPWDRSPFRFGVRLLVWLAGKNT